MIANKLSAVQASPPVPLSLRERGDFGSPTCQELAAPERAGELFPLLLRAFFRRFDVARLDHWPALPEVADLTAFWLWHLTGPRIAGGMDGGYLHYILTPQALARRFERAAEPIKPWAIMQVRFLDPLADFGLLTPIPDQDRTRDVGDVGCRKEPLFDRAVRFTIPPPQAAKPAPSP
jgi:hypothetical protein